LLEREFKNVGLPAHEGPSAELSHRSVQDVGPGILPIFHDAEVSVAPERLDQGGTLAPPDPFPQWEFMPFCDGAGALTAPANGAR
jgi:hypothetical protein